MQDELGGGQEAYVHAPVDRAHAQRGGQVGLAASGLPVEHEVLGPADEVQGEQLVPGVPVGQLHVREVVAVQRCVCSMELWPVEHRVSVQLSGGF